MMVATAAPVTASAATNTSPAKVTITSVKRVSNTKTTVKWKKLKKCPSGYGVYVQSASREKNRQVEASEENRQEDHQRNSKNFPGEHVQGESPCLQEWKEEIRKVGQVQQHENLRRDLPEQDYKPERLFR